MDEKIENKTTPPVQAGGTARIGLYNVISIVCFALAGIIALLTIWFTYNYTFNTINRIQTIDILRQDLQIQPINFSMYEAVVNKREAKIFTSPLGQMPNPFLEKEIATGTKRIIPTGSGQVPTGSGQAN